jgi:hypothetical protein
MGSTSQPVVTVLRKFLMQRQEQRHGVFTLLGILVAHHANVEKVY